MDLLLILFRHFAEFGQEIPGSHHPLRRIFRRVTCVDLSHLLTLLALFTNALLMLSKATLALDTN